MSTNNKTCGMVAVIGAPNAGKSTFVNAVTGQKVSIVTPKAQTTRNRIRGIVVHNNSQIILIDTPGIFKIQGKLNNRLNHSIVETARNAFEGIDCLLLMLDSSREISSDDSEVLEILKSSNARKILVLNKVDLVQKEKLLELSKNLSEQISFEKVFMVDSIRKSGIRDIMDHLAKTLPEGPFLYPEDEVSDFPARLLAADITREKLFLNMHEEIPYNTMVETEKFEEGKKDIKIYQSIYTISESHKKMIIGNKGAAVKRVGEQARKELTELFGKKVHLFLHVKVRENWMDNRENYNISGIDFKS